MSRVWRHIKEGFLGAFRHGALFFSSLSSVTITLVLMSIFMLLNANIDSITRKVEQMVSLHVQVERDLDESQIESVINSVKELPGVSTVEYSDKDQELEKFIALSGEEGEELYGQYRGDTNPMTPALIVGVQSGESIQAIGDNIKNLEGIFKVNYGGDASEDLLSVMISVRNVALIFVVVLVGIAVFLISNTISATVHSREREISIMRTVGATNWFIRWPFVVEGMIIGIMGSIVPILVTVFGYRAVYNQVGNNFGVIFAFVSPEGLVWEVSLVILAVGVTVGALGSLLTVSRRLRWTR